ncbi:MAG: hypothetical protein AABW51_02715 [Nanoarchaeota archaeon]
MKIKLDKKGKVKLVLIALFGLYLLLVPLILSINETNDTNVVNDSQLNVSDNLVIQDFNITNETIINETTADIIQTTDANIQSPIGEIDYTTISLPYGEEEISVIIDYPTETNNCVTLNKANKNSMNAYSTATCDGKYHEKLSTLLKQAGII